MNGNIVVAVITASASASVVALTYYLTKKKESAAKWQNEKLNHYKVLISSISDLKDRGIDFEVASRKYILAVNTIALVAPQYVINALMHFQDEIKNLNPSVTQERHDELLKLLLLAIRKDLGLAKGDNANTINFHLTGTAP